MKKYLPVILIGLAALSCTSKKEAQAPKSGMWRGTISLNDSIDMPFNFEWNAADSSMIIMNATERIKVTKREVFGDSIRFSVPVFANFIEVKAGEEEMNGYFVNPDADNYRLPFNALYGDYPRFSISDSNCCDINEKWAVKFATATEDEDVAIAYFEQDDTHVTATFLTETGDYRFLEGVLSGEKLMLSAFDGAHLFYFDGKINSGQKIEGRFFSGRSYFTNWIAYRDDDFKLRNADSLTYLKEGYNAFNFSFKNTSGDIVSLQDEQFKNKSVIVQIMGSWCPNCMDESRYLTEVYKQYHKDGLEVVGLSFERTKDWETAEQRVEKMINDIGIPYTVLVAGATRNDKAAELLPSLNHIMSYPTAIYLDRAHNIKKIHTGFSGPGTPVYKAYVEKNKSVIEQMVFGSH